MKKNNEKKENIEIKFSINKGKLLKGVGVVAAVCLILGLSFFVSKSYGANTSTFEYVNITIDEYLELMKSDTKKIIYIARPSCSFCIKQSPILKRVASKYELEINYLNTENFYDATIQDYTEDGYKLINSAKEYANGFGTPNTIIVQNGEIVDGIFQYSEASELEDLFERNGFINE